MARNISAVCRLCRRSGDKLMLKGNRCFTPKCAVDRRGKPPGMANARRRRTSDRGLQLREKQKAKYSYGILERQFRRFFAQAEKQAGITGENLLVLLERRMDNVIYRLGFADSRPQARQLVMHGHILLNGKKNDIPSSLVKEGDTITWREGSTKTGYYEQMVQIVESKVIPNWLSLEKEKLVGRVISLPKPDAIDTKFQWQGVVEYYSR
jgi:small subunit ribosomal protein S4